MIGAIFSNLWSGCSSFTSSAQKDSFAQPLQTDQEKKETKEIEELKVRDQQVRAHEQAHKSVAGSYAAGGMSFDYQVGPDGKRYAVGGEVSIDLSKEQTPEKTIQKANTVRAAALAPADPSAQDRKVAAMASRMEQDARQELSTEKQERTNAAPMPAEPEKSDQPRSEAAFGSLPEHKSAAPRPPHARTEMPNADMEKIAKNRTPNLFSVIKAYQENTPSSLSPVDTMTAGMVTLSMAI